MRFANSDPSLRNPRSPYTHNHFGTRPLATDRLNFGNRPLTESQDRLTQRKSSGRISDCAFS